MKKTFSFDAETDGLWGKAFAIGAVVYDEGKEIDRFTARLPDDFVQGHWSRENVLPKLGNMPVTHDSYESMLQDFATFYLKHKDADKLVHMGYIVEAGLLRDMYSLGMISTWDGPFPLFDVSGNLQQAGFDPTSVDKYAADHGILIPSFEGGTHNPLYDSVVTYEVYRHLLNRQA